MALPPRDWMRVTRLLLPFLAREHHLHDVRGLRVRDAQPVHELRLFAELAEHLRDLGSAAVHQHHLHPDEGEKDEVAHDGALQRLVAHGAAAVFDEQDLAAVLLDVRERLD